MRLPPVDEYRQPFVEPIGHLAMQAAYAEDELATLCSTVPSNGSQLQMHRDEAAHRLRNWTADGRVFAYERLKLIERADVRERAIDALNRYDQLREKRNRAIHDAIAIGLLGDVDTGYQTQALRVSTIRVDRNRTETAFSPITPKQIAELACEMYEVQKDFDSVAYSIISDQAE